MVVRMAGRWASGARAARGRRAGEAASMLSRRSTDVRWLAYADRMAKVVVQFSCSECGATTGRWLGKCPGCGAFGTLVEELHGRDGRRGPGRVGPRAPRRRSFRGGREALDGRAGARPRPRRGPRARPRSCSSAGSRASASRRCCSPPSVRRAERAASPFSSPARSRSPRCALRAERLGGADDVSILAETELEAVCATLEKGGARRVRDRLRADALCG